MTFQELPAHARLWVHVADRDLSSEEQQALKSGLSSFLEGWSAHGAALSAAGDVLYDRVCVVGLDEEQAGATGCSIDKLVGFMRAHGQSHGLDWFDRHQVLWRPNGQAGAAVGQRVWKATRTAEFWAMRKAGVVTSDAEVVDPLAATVGAAVSQNGFLVKRFDESWHAEMWR
ncbi:MAG: hypothetical protein L7S67_02980 [Flavobacteriales bacterium]|nr:hypothetical protein [Flavobacteriales bacterium]